MSSPRWNPDSRLCSHEGDNVCPFCDFDGYYEVTYPGCPWAESDKHAEVVRGNDE